MDEDRLPAGKYAIPDPEHIRKFMHNNRDFYGMKFESLHKEINVIGVDEGDWVTYTVDGHNKDYNMELYPFERIYKKVD
jgi:hypothetical protein